jgi:hypothetical protein
MFRKYLWMVILQSCCFASLAHAQPDARKADAKLVCKSALAEKYPLPATLPSEALRRDIPARPLLESPTEIEVVCGVFGRQWRSQRTPSYLVFLETAIFRRASVANAAPVRKGLRSALYRQDVDGQYRLVAKSAEPFELRGEKKVDDLDLAPYRLTENEYAFGVLTLEDYDGCEGSYCYGTRSFLEIFRVNGKVIRPILSTLLWSEASSTGPVNDDNLTRDTETLGDRNAAVISVLKTRTRGVFDWKKRKRAKSAIFKWNGERYETADEDPVIDYSP